MIGTKLIPKDSLTGNPEKLLIYGYILEGNRFRVYAPVENSQNNSAEIHVYKTNLDSEQLPVSPELLVGACSVKIISPAYFSPECQSFLLNKSDEKKIESVCDLLEKK